MSYGLSSLPGAIVRLVPVVVLPVLLAVPAFVNAQPQTASDAQTEPAQSGGTARNPNLSPQAGNPADSQTAKPQPLPEVTEEVTVTARRVEEQAQDVPIPLSIVGGAEISKTGAFNVNRLKELIPTVQFYSSNPRNSAINIRGLGAPFGLTNDGIEQGVGFYLDGVYFARPAAATLDFLDLERIEVLRGPQGTLFGKNTTAGAINITSRRPSFSPETNFELSYGDLNYVQAKASISGPLGKKVAARLSFSGTQRDGVLKNVITGQDINSLNNLGIRGQLMFVPTSKLLIMFTGDYTRQRPNGYAQTIAGVAPTLRPLNRQYAQIAADLGYTPPSFNAFDRKIDTDTPWRSNQELGGGSATIDWQKGPGTLTSITAWRYWNWNPSSDRDFTGLPVTTKSAAPSRQAQFTQEIRYAGEASPNLNFLAGFFFFRQTLHPTPYQVQEQGSAAARFLLDPTKKGALTPGLLDGYGSKTNFDFSNISAAGFGQIDYRVLHRLHVVPGLRLNYDQKYVNYDQEVYGGLQTDDPKLIALQRSILAPLAYKVDKSKNNVSGNITLDYQATENLNTYATFSTGFKSLGLNLGGVPTDANNNPILSAATVKPEAERHWEVGFKARPISRLTTNVTAFNTNIRDYQTQVVSDQIGVLRGYLASADRVRVRGLEFDGNAKATENLRISAALALTDGRYMKFPDAPPPLEETGGPQAKDISGSILPGISRWAASSSAEYARHSHVLDSKGEFFIRLDASFRSHYSSSPSFSKYLVVNSYEVLNSRAGFRSNSGWALSLFVRNFANRNYYEFLTPAPGSSGLYVGLPADPRTYGITLSRSFTIKGISAQ